MIENEQEHSTKIQQAIVGAILVLIAALSMGWLLAGIIVKPIKTLQRAMMELAQGNLTISVEEKVITNCQLYHATSTQLF